jgi:hypothetical protein
MANGQTIHLTSNGNRSLAHHWIDRAPHGAVLNIREATRTTEQNDKMWAMLSDVSRAKPMGRTLKPEGWKAIFMDMIGKRPSWEPNLDGSGVVCIGYKSSHLSKDEMSQLIESIYAFGAEHGVHWTEPQERAA